MARFLKVLLFVLLAAVGLSTVGFGGFWLLKQLPGLPGFSNVVDLTYMPENLEGVMSVRPARIVASPIMQKLMTKQPRIRQSLTANQGPLQLTPEDLDTVTVGFWKDEYGSAQLPGMISMIPWSRNGLAMLIQMKLNRALDPATASLGTPTDYNGTTLYTSGSTTIWMPSSTTVVVGEDRIVRAAVDRGGKGFRFSRFDFVGDPGDVLIAGVGNSPGSSGTGVAPPGFTSIARLSSSIGSKAEAVGVTVQMSSRIDIAAAIQCRAADQSTSLLQEVESAIAEGKSNFQQARDNPMLASMAGPLESILNGLTASRSGSTVYINAAIEQSVIDAIPQ